MSKEPREFVSSLATRILDMTPQGLIDFGGSYEEYLQSQEQQAAQAKARVQKAR